MTSRSYRAISCVKTRPFISWKPPLYSPQHGGKRQIWERNIISEAKMDITESQKWLNVSLKAHLDSVTSLTDVFFLTFLVATYFILSLVGLRRSTHPDGITHEYGILSWMLKKTLKKTITNLKTSLTCLESSPDVTKTWHFLQWENNVTRNREYRVVSPI